MLVGEPCRPWRQGSIRGLVVVGIVGGFIVAIAQDEFRRVLRLGTGLDHQPIVIPEPFQPDRPRTPDRWERR